MHKPKEHQHGLRQFGILITSSDHFGSGMARRYLTGSSGSDIAVCLLCAATSGVVLLSMECLYPSESSEACGGDIETTTSGRNHLGEEQEQNQGLLFVTNCSRSVIALVALHKQSGRLETWPSSWATVKASQLRSRAVIMGAPRSNGSDGEARVYATPRRTGKSSMTWLLGHCEALVPDSAQLGHAWSPDDS